MKNNTDTSDTGILLQRCIMLFESLWGGNIEQF